MRTTKYVNVKGEMYDNKPAENVYYAQDGQIKLSTPTFEMTVARKEVPVAALLSLECYANIEPITEKIPTVDESLLSITNAMEVKQDLDHVRSQISKLARVLVFGEGRLDLIGWRDEMRALLQAETNAQAEFSRAVEGL